MGGVTRPLGPRLQLLQRLGERGGDAIRILITLLAIADGRALRLDDDAQPLDLIREIRVLEQGQHVDEDGSAHRRRGIRRDDPAERFCGDRATDLGFVIRQVAHLHEAPVGDHRVRHVARELARVEDRWTLRCYQLE